MANVMWFWAALGLVLLAVEMATGTFYVLWFGVSAVSVAIAMWLFPNIPYVMQLAMFAALSISSLAIWRLNYKMHETHSRVGQAQGEEIGRTGTVIMACSPNQVGKIHFTQGLMGAREWAAVSSEPIAKDVEARVIAVEGNQLRIQALQHT